MKIIFNRQLLINTVSPLMCAVAPKGTNPVTEYIQISATAEKGIVLTTYDLEKGDRTAA
jgi:DNA polymerase III sliding clamp (beta) subunit (PCNA family)